MMWSRLTTSVGRLEMELTSFTVEAYRARLLEIA